ncbi:MAG: hypothetical protein A2161_09150 [Candidatus Schekmanbacteria bacterium RBG_13_48_7]|uniref:Uncharacterized protein n=1 Tax=Candidatus Schekmanbacteria bacterium RBG_13_48_7 TaxID=1817878 RepID=A0A1F7S2A1_9BACT|nr:MAG: hypothetical protein A2161_09150 [Candidatus Schekmanbacteria bacterium RBG_13_48_7]
MTGGIDNLVKDGKTVASKGATLLVTVGGISAGLGLVTADIKMGLLDDLLASIGIDNNNVKQAVAIVGGLLLMGLVLSLRTMVSNIVLKMIFLFILVLLGTYLLVKVIRIVLKLFGLDKVIKGGK